jgi:hypothetical protein
MNALRLSRVARIAALLAAATILIAADGALAKGNGGHNQGSDQSQMKNRDRSATQPSLREVRKDMNKGDMRSKEHQDRDAKREERKAEREAMRAQRKADREAMRALRKAEREARRAQKTTDKDKMNAGTATTPTTTTTTATGNVHTITEKTNDKMNGTATTTTTAKSNPPAADAGKDLFGRGVVGRPITDTKQVPGSPAPGSVTGPGAANTVRPIISKQTEMTKDKMNGTTTTTTTKGTPTKADSGLLVDKGVVGKMPTDMKPIPGSPASTASGTVTGPSAGNTVHPIPGSAAAGTASSPGATNAVRAVTITTVKGNSFQIQDRGGGVAVYSDRPGTLTISNGVQRQTLSGAKVTISGASYVEVAKGIGTGPRQADGSVVVLQPNGTVTGGPDPHAFGGLAGFLTGGGFEAHASEPQTSTIQQQ